MQEQDPVLITKKVYDDIAKEYADTWHNWSEIELYSPIFLKYLNGKKILDLGCGFGRDSKYFLENGFDYTGLDISESMLELGKTQNPNAKFILGDMRNLPFENNSFDGIWSVSSLLHIPKKELLKTLKESYRILKTKGIFFATLQKGTFEGFREKDNYGNVSRYFSYFFEDEITKYFEKAGFKVLEIFNKEFKSNKSEKVNTWINVFASKK